MDAWNLGIAQMAIRAVVTPDLDEIERDFTDRYQRAIDTSGHNWAEALAKSEALHVLLQLDFDGAAYLASYLRLHCWERLERLPQRPQPAIQRRCFLQPRG